MKVFFCQEFHYGAPHGYQLYSHVDSGPRASLWTPELPLIDPKKEDEGDDEKEEQQ